MIDLRKFHPHPWAGKTNLSAGVPMQLKWDFETGLVTEEDPNNETICMNGRLFQLNTESFNAHCKETA